MNLTKECEKISQAFEAMKEQQLDRRCAEILHDLGIRQIYPTQTTIPEIMGRNAIISQNKPIVAVK